MPNNTCLRHESKPLCAGDNGFVQGRFLFFPFVRPADGGDGL